jgi:hypothetical protein
VGAAAADLAFGRRPSRVRSLAAAVVIGATAAMLTYRLLRRAPDSPTPVE